MTDQAKDKKAEKFIEREPIIGGNVFRIDRRPPRKKKNIAKVIEVEKFHHRLLCAS